MGSGEGRAMLCVPATGAEGWACTYCKGKLHEEDATGASCWTPTQVDEVGVGVEREGEGTGGQVETGAPPCGEYGWGEESHCPSSGSW